MRSTSRAPGECWSSRSWRWSEAGWSATATSRPRTSRAPTTDTSPKRISTSARTSTTPTSSRSSRPRSSSASTRTCPPRSCAPASSWATSAAAGPRHSTSSTGRCARSRGGCSSRSRRVASAPVDVVSVDYVADGIYELCEGPGGIGETYHLTAGASASTIGEIAQMASGYFRRPVPKVLPPDEFEIDPDSREGQALEGSRVLLPVLLDQGGVRQRRHAVAAGPRRHRRRAAARVPRSTAGLRDADPLGQAPDRPRRGARFLSCRSRRAYGTRP